MTQSQQAVVITFRIPGQWAHPGELQERLPEGFGLTPDALVLPDGDAIEFVPMEPDDQFAEIFRSSCRTTPTDAELATVAGYTVNVGLSGAGGSLESALTMMRAAAAIVQAGGAGVFIDNSALAHSGQAWLGMLEDGSPDALSFAYVSIVDGAKEIWTMGMQSLGLPDLEMAHACGNGDEIIDILRYVCGSEKPIGQGHVVANEHGPRFHVFEIPDERGRTGSAMFNPWGRLQLKSVQRMAEDN